MRFSIIVSGNFPYIAYNNVPQGFAPYLSSESPKLFIAVPRRNPGIPSTLNYVKIEDGQDVYLNPKLHSYPNYQQNELDVSEGLPYVKWKGRTKRNPSRKVQIAPEASTCETSP